MSDNRTPTELGTVSAERMFDQHPSQGEPDVFFESATYMAFIVGRDFNTLDERDFQAAYRARWEELAG